MRTVTEVANSTTTHVDTWASGASTPPGIWPVGWVQRSWVRSEITKVVPVNGWREPKPYQSDEVITRYPECDVEIHYPNPSGSNVMVKRSHIGPMYPNFSGLIPSAKEPDQKAWNKLYYDAIKKVKDQQLNLAVTLAEMGETVNLIASRANLFRQLFDLARHKRWDEVLQLLGLKNYTFRKGQNDLAGRWLELWFGWAPILADCYSAIDELGRGNLEDGFLIVARASMGATPSGFVASLPGDSRMMGSNASHPGIWTFQNSSKEGYKTSLWFKLDMPMLLRASALGLTNPFEVAWELTRLSFVFDWWAPVGDFLASLDGTYGATYLGGTNSWWYHVTNEIQRVRYDQSMIPPGEIESANIKSQKGEFSIRSSRRTVVTEQPPPLYLKNPFSTWRAVTAVALVRQMRP